MHLKIQDSNQNTFLSPSNKTTNFLSTYEYFDCVKTISIVKMKKCVKNTHIICKYNIYIDSVIHIQYNVIYQQYQVL